MNRYKTFCYEVNFREDVKAEDFELVAKPIVKTYRQVWDGYYKGLKILTEQCKNYKKVLKKTNMITNPKEDIE